MKQIILLIGILAIAILVVVGCEEKPTKPEEKNAKLSISMSIQPAIDLGYTVTRVHVRITKSSFADSMDLTISGNSAYGTFTGLEAGTYTVNVYVYQNSTLIATGTGTGTVTAGQTTTVTVTVYFTGNITVIVTWGVDLKTGLIAYYPFTGNANDSSGNSNNGTVHGATLTADRFGNDSSSYSFNGTNNYIDLGFKSVFQFTNEITISAWIKFNSNGLSQTIASHGDNAYHLYIQNPSTKNEYINWAKALVSNIGANYDTLKVLPNVWYHIVAVNRINNDVKVYINGLLKKTKTFSYAYSYSKNLRIGSTDSENFFFNGIIDDVRIYNRALSDSEIQALYNLK
jgi:hypothetical protein